MTCVTLRIDRNAHAIPENAHARGLADRLWLGSAPGPDERLRAGFDVGRRHPGLVERSADAEAGGAGLAVGAI